MARKKKGILAFLTNGFSTPATTSVTWDKRWIAAMSTCLVTCDGRIDRNSTVGLHFSDLILLNFQLRTGLFWKKSFLLKNAQSALKMRLTMTDKFVQIFNRHILPLI